MTQLGPALNYTHHSLLTFGGPLAGIEEWSCSVRFYHGGFPPAPISPIEEVAEFTRDHLGDVRNDVEAYFTGTGSRFSSLARLGFVKWNAIKPDGNYYDRGQTNAYYWTGSLPVSGTTGILPPQCAMVVSLRTAMQRGRAHSGRYYVPLGGAVGVDGRLDAAVAQTAANAAADFIRNLNNWPGADPGVAPRVTVMSAVEGEHHAVTAVRVGRVVDTQRRRRRSLEEEYVAIAL